MEAALKFVADSSERGHFSPVRRAILELILLLLVVVVIIRAPTSIFMEQLRDSGGGNSIGIGKEVILRGGRKEGGKTPNAERITICHLF